MKILGISGFEGAAPFKRRHWPGLDPREYRIGQGFDAAAALVVDGELVAAAAEERFDRVKHSAAFPAGAIAYCLAEAGLAPDGIDELAHGFDYGPYRAAYQLDPLSAELYREVLSPEAVRSQVVRHLGACFADRVRHVEHHLAHAASAYFASGWDECLVAVVDGMGETQGASIYRAGPRAHDGDVGLEKLAEISARDSIGILYSVVTLHLGFEFNSGEYKIMGLAPYGDPGRFRDAFSRMVERLPDGTLRIPPLHLNRTREERATYAATRRLLAAELVLPRAPDDPIGDEHRDVAAALQECLDLAMLHVCGHFARATGLGRLAMAGGVALNCTANGKLQRSGRIEELFVQPAAGDDGAALGAALVGAARRGEAESRRILVPFYGPAPAPDEIERALEAHRGEIEVERLEGLAATAAAAADEIARGRVIAWCRGRMEFGPRALGHRSILADPGGPDMRDRINALIKKRESFRPFAPAVTVREVSRWFEVAAETELPFMISTVAVRPEHRSALPAVTHVDGSARVQTVSPADNGDFHAVLVAVGERTGREMVLNTSFNVRGQPIVATPREAIETFLASGLDVLFLEDLAIRRAGAGSS